MNQTESRAEVEVDLFQLAHVLWQKAWIIAIAAVICAGAAFLGTKLFVTPMYKAQTTLYVMNKDFAATNQAGISSNDLSTSQKLVDTYTVFLQSRSTLEDVILQAGLPYRFETLKRMVSAKAVDNTGAFHVVVSSTDPDEAAKIANTIGEVLPGKIADFIPGSSVKIVDYAVVPNAPYTPSYSRNLVLGALVGILLTCVILVVRELTDSLIHDPDYLTQTYDIPVLAVIPDLLDTQSAGGYFKEPAEAAHQNGRGGKNRG